MNFWEITLLLATCTLTATPPDACLQSSSTVPALSSSAASGPTLTGSAVDVVLTAQAAIAWDVDSGAVLYSRNPTTERPIASLTKLLSALVIRERLRSATIVEIPEDVREIQRKGVHIKLLPGEHASVESLLSASLIASANDAIVALGVAVAGSEEKFVDEVNSYAAAHGFKNTKVANATGLAEGEQYSTAEDVRRLLTEAYADPVLRPYLSASAGTLVSVEGKRHSYTSTNDLLQTYVPILAAKTGFTYEAGENLAIITVGSDGKRIGAVILGSEDRFQDMKILVEWIWRNYSW